MFRTLLIGVWACAITAGATYGGAWWRARRDAPPAEHEEKLDVKKIRPITVPIISGGALKGYVSAEFSFLGAKQDGHAEGLDPEGFFMDEAFRLIYGDSRIDFTNIQKADLAALTSQLTANVNKRLGAAVVKETLIRNFTFVAREDMPR